MTSAIAIELFEILESREFKNFSHFGKMSFAAVLENSIKKNYFIKIYFKKQNPIYIIEFIDNTIIYYTDFNNGIKKRNEILKNHNLKIGRVKFKLDDNGKNKVDNKLERFGEVKLLHGNNPCNQEHLPYNVLHDTIEGGIGISTKSASRSGTLGGLFKDDKDNIYGISNSHVLKIYGDSKDFYTVLHPGDDGAVSNSNKLKLGEVIEKSREFTPYLDFILFNIYESQKARCINSTRFKNLTFNQFGTAKFNDEVYKAGRSSNLTKGRIISTRCCTFRKNSVFFKDQLLLSCMAIPGDSGSLVANANEEVVGLIHSYLPNDYTFASKAEYIKRNIKENHINFKQFITSKSHIMSKEVKVKIGSDKTHQLLERIKDGDKLFEIEAKFSKWNGDVAKELTIIKNDFEKESQDFIFDARFVNVEHCNTNSNCKELQLLAYTDKNLKKVEIPISCDFSIDKINVVLVKFSKDEMNNRLYERNVCSNCYEQEVLLNKDKQDLVNMILSKDLGPTPIPTVKDGNILRGVR